MQRMYIVFAVYPYTPNLPRAVLKPPKVYFFDNGDVVGDEGARFENLVATSLLKRLHPEKAVQITAHLKHPFDINNIRVTDAGTFFSDNIY